MKNNIKILLVIGLCIPILGMPGKLAAEFALNFTPIKATSGITTNSILGCSTTGGQTPFLMELPGSCQINTPEVVNDPGTGLNYYHMIVGSAADGWIQESFVQTGVIPGTILSCAGNTCSTNLNNRDPLGGSGLYYTGNAEANPRGVIIREILSDGEMQMEFLKDKYDKKPLITQVLSAPDATSLFQIDMRNSSYSDMNTPGTIINLFSLPGQTVGAFDMAKDAPSTNVTAGRYTYTNGAGNGGSQGTYNYLEGGVTFDPDWTVYMDKLDARNIWTFTTYKP